MKHTKPWSRCACVLVVLGTLLAAGRGDTHTGALDPTFGAAGIVMLTAGENTLGSRVALVPGGGMIVVADATRYLLPGRTLAIDVWNAGAEYEFNRLIALRIGYISDPIGTIEDMTYGFGIGYRGFRFDFANVPQSEFLDRVNRFSAGYRF